MKLIAEQHFSIAYGKMLQVCVAGNDQPVTSRVGKCIDLGPAVLDLAPGGNRWCLLPQRAINPFFALHEISWILGGSNEVAGMQYYISNYYRYSDDGRTLNGAYGFRLRHHFGFDQLTRAVEELRSRPDSRRICLTTWSADDLGRKSEDIPCNVTVAVKLRNGRLDLTVFNRSNDAYRGVPYDVLSFGALQAYLAWALGVLPGRQVHFIDSLHLYVADLARAHEALAGWDEHAWAHCQRVKDSELVECARLDHGRLAREYDRPVSGSGEILPVRNSYFLWREGRGLEALASLPETTLGLAAAVWFVKRTPTLSVDLPSWLKSLQLFPR